MKTELEQLQRKHDALNEASWQWISPDPRDIDYVNRKCKLCGEYMGGTSDAQIEKDKERHRRLGCKPINDAMILLEEQDEQKT